MAAKTSLPMTPVVAALTAEWATLDALATGLSDDQWAAPSVLPGWSVADVVAHVIGTESMLAGREVDARRDVAALEHVRNPIGELNERWLDHFRGSPRGEVMAAYRDIIAVRTDMLSRMTQAEFDDDSFTPAGPDSYGRFMRIRVFDCWMHEIDIRDSTDGSAPVDPVPAELALDEIAASMPFVVGKRAATPKGTSVLMRIGGVVSRSIRIEVGDRAAAVDEFDGGDGSADVVLSLDARDLARLAGGRRTADHGRVVIDGDRALGTAILDNLDYVI
ncbi:maleylpyruvate isomerase family mycothiol-dependent enzyme [Gordonia sp. SID5947]|uniref:maleylpyruvate isomerase family mycothiol-dependent enzyme n=1 Tax=Gordonia sp. SID5947 TaxID=2690315 RepID=UPI00136B8167|nr:maleylpyruvate isomerase family mycothiol-dependent enzyme [Gordonia sp. SID5947]MYR05136.1 maleylpyruvate isomerase family mycothiol-dependent enzyme [Gordonia sp. SID5947]